jgi:hypothetical protein
MTLMEEKLFITSENTVVFRCPHCQRTKTVDVATLGDLARPLRFRLKCPCGQVTSSVIDKRRRFRKETSFPGTYVHYVDGQPRGKGSLTVKDLSVNGMKLMIASGETFNRVDVLKVAFKLDDAKRSLVEKKVVIRSISPPFFGTEFAPTETLDKALGFYLRF